MSSRGVRQTHPLSHRHYQLPSSARDSHTAIRCHPLQKPCRLNLTTIPLRTHQPSTKATQAGSTLPALLQPGWKSAASQWGREQLLAHRVVCSRPADQLHPLKDIIKQSFRNPSTAHPCIAWLVEGPESIDGLKDLSEPQIVHKYQPYSLGYVWAALLPFVRATAGSGPGPQPAGASSMARPRRVPKAPERYGGGVPSDQADLGSSPDSQHQPATSDSDTSMSSAGYTEKSKAPILEEATVRLASCFIRCVLNYAQPVERPGLFLEFRDERLNYSYKLARSHPVHAVDDGGIQVFIEGTTRQVALLEGKRTFQKIVDGKAIITDELLAQLVGEALALALQPSLMTATGRAVTRTE